VVAPGVYPLVVDPIIINTRLLKVLMDGGSSLNIIYLETLDLLGIDRARLQPSAGGFHGVIPRKKALQVGRIDLPVCFGTAANFRKEVLTFEVVGFRSTYHAIIGRPGYAKLMAIPNYTYLKLKMPGPNRVITVSSSYEHAYHCDIEFVEYGEAVENSVELASKLEALAAEAPEHKRHASSFEWWCICPGMVRGGCASQPMRERHASSIDPTYVPGWFEVDVHPSLCAGLSGDVYLWPRSLSSLPPRNNLFRRAQCVVWRLWQLGQATWWILSNPPCCG